MTADQNRRRGSARLGAGTVEPGGSPPVYELRLRKKSGRQSILFSLRAPVLAPVAPEVAERHAFWMCDYSVKKGRKQARHMAYGATWLDAFTSAVAGLRRSIPVDELHDWVTMDGIEFWRMFPDMPEAAKAAPLASQPHGEATPPVYSLTLRNRRKKKQLHFTMSMPEAVARPLWARSDAPDWRCSFTVTQRRKTVTKVAYGDDWPGAITNALEAMRRMIPDEEECDWETDEGVPSWCVFPKTVPIAWDYAFHHKLWSMIKAEDRKLQDSIEARRLLYEQGLLPKGKLQRPQAERIVSATLQLHAALGTLDAAVSDLASGRDQRRMADALGIMLRTVREAVLLPICRDFPDLCPDELKEG
jgi:hypothetical protein